MLLRVIHTTDYRYGEPVAEAYLELRLTPLSREGQTVQDHRLTIEPARRTSGYRDYFQPTDMVKIGREAVQWAKRYLPGQIVLRKGLENLNNAIYENFQYRKGATNFSTDLSSIWRDRIGVCQDFAHIMLSILRTAGLPSRYVCGYVETSPPRGQNGEKKRLVGSVATHAWVEILLPGQ